jgi:hypothetical protein
MKCYEFLYTLVTLLSSISKTIENMKVTLHGLYSKKTLSTKKELTEFIPLESPINNKKYGGNV